jgi:hypothetical protein
MTGATVLDRYDGAAMHQRFEAAGILQALQRKGFTDLEVRIDSAGRSLPHVLLLGSKNNVRSVLLDACVGEAVVRPAYFVVHGFAIERPVEVAVVHWVREEDPTAAFTADRPALPLQEHPGLGVLRSTFRVITRIAAELQKDGVVSVPKFYHDAVIFYRSRLFLFLDGAEQGRFEALMRDLSTLRLGDASLAIASGRVRDAQGGAITWVPGYQVFPLSPPLTAYFHSPSYAAQVAAERGTCRFTIESSGPPAGLA